MTGERTLLDTAQVLDRIRDARFSAGVRCPRCDEAKGVAKWGSFAGRRRYRCGGCKRTFSDLTGTPAAYTKKLWLWGLYARCMANGMSVRTSARSAGIAVSTAFRWRHVILDELCALDEEVLSGIIEIGDLWFAYSRKGERDLNTPRTRGPRSRVRFPRRLVVRVIVATDRRVGIVTDVAHTHVVGFRDLIESLQTRLEGKPTLVAAQGRLGPIGRLARLIEGEFVDVRGGVALRPGTLWHVRTLSAYSRRLIGWIRRFHGVATKYLPNYLIWHRIVDAAERFDPAAAVLRWSITTGFT